MNRTGTENHLSHQDCSHPLIKVKTQSMTQSTTLFNVVSINRKSFEWYKMAEIDVHFKISWVRFLLNFTS